MHLFGYFQQFQIKCSQWQAILHPSLSGSLEYFPFVGLLKCQPLYPILPCNRIRKRSRTIQYSSASPQKNDCLINRCEDLARPIKIFLCIFALRILEKLSSFWIILVQRIEYGGLVMLYFLLMRKKKSLSEAEMYEVDMQREAEMTWTGKEERVMALCLSSSLTGKKLFLSLQWSESMISLCMRHPYVWAIPMFELRFCHLQRENISITFIRGK